MTLLNVQSACCLACLITGASIAAAAAARAESPPLEVIVVTAQRQPVAALATPLSIGRVDRDAIELLGATHSSEVLNRVPGVMVQRGSGQESLTAIRSPVLTGAGSCGAFLFLENGVPIRPVGFCNVNEMLEINTEQADAIEILRGTGSALYGSNSVHGTINVLQDAPPDLPRWQLGLGLGPDQYTRGSLVASHQGETTASGIKALYTHDGGWRDQSGFDEGKLNATLTTGAGGSIPSRFDLAATKLEQQTAGFILGENAYRDPDLRQQNLNPEAYRDAHAVRITGLVQPQAALPGRLELRPYFRDIEDHVSRIIKGTDTIREMLTTAIQVNLALVTVGQNEVVKRLAGWGAILAIPTVVFSMYGMNFKFMPELGGRFAYPMVVDKTLLA
mgnify:CR=1 FL=1